jgi:hypothetical protein
MGDISFRSTAATKNHVLPKSWSETSARKAGEVSDKIFNDNRNKQLPIPLAKGDLSDKEFRDCLYRCFVPEENQKVTETQAKRDPSVRVAVDKTYGWDSLFMNLYKLQATVEVIKARHFVLLSAINDISNRDVPYGADTDARSAFFDGSATPAQIINLIKFRVEALKGRYSAAVTNSAFQALLDDTTHFIEYRDAMRQFMADDSSFIFKREGAGIDILWTGDGGLGQTPTVSIDKPPVSYTPSKKNFREKVQGSITSQNQLNQF